MISRRGLIKNAALAAPALILPHRRLWAAGHGTPLNDGFSASGTAGIAAQRPTLLNSYVKRPPWRVAGVDYAVGPQVGTSPVAVSNGSGFSTSFSNFIGTLTGLYGGSTVIGDSVFSTRTINITGTTGAIFDQWDFTSDGGFVVLLSGCVNTSFTNCLFNYPSVATSTGLILGNNGSGSNGYTITNCTANSALGLSAGSNLLSGNNTAGTVVLKYNWIKNMPAQCPSLVGQYTLDYRFNLIENICTGGPANHLNYLISQNAKANPNITQVKQVQFNTCYQEIQITNGEGFQFHTNDGTNAAIDQDPILAYNCMIAAQTNSNASARQSNHGYNLGDCVTVGDVPGVFFFCSTAGTSAGSEPAGYAAWSATVPFSDGTASFVGNNLAMSNMVHGTVNLSPGGSAIPYSNTPGCVCPTPIWGQPNVHDNYFDPTSSLNAFYPGSFVAPWIASQNYNMNTGALITPA